MAPIGCRGRRASAGRRRSARAAHGAASAARRSRSVTRPSPSGCSPRIALQHRGRRLVLGPPGSLPGGHLPTCRDRGHDHLRVEASERGGDDFSGYLTHARTAAREVRLQLRPGHAVCVDGAPVEAERLVRRVRLGGEVHAGRYRFHCVAQPAGSLSEVVRCHPRIASRRCRRRHPDCMIGGACPYTCRVNCGSALYGVDRVRRNGGASRRRSSSASRVGSTRRGSVEHVFDGGLGAFRDSFDDASRTQARDGVAARSPRRARRG